MALYRFIFVASPDKLPKPPKALECRDDEAAIEKAFELLDAVAVEVWRGSRLIVRLEPKAFPHRLQ